MSVSRQNTDFLIGNVAKNCLKGCLKRTSLLEVCSFQNVIDENYRGCLYFATCICMTCDGI